MEKRDHANDHIGYNYDNLNNLGPNLDTEYQSESDTTTRTFENARDVDKKSIREFSDSNSDGEEGVGEEEDAFLTEIKEFTHSNQARKRRDNEAAYYNNYFNDDLIGTNKELEVLGKLKSEHLNVNNDFNALLAKPRIAIPKAHSDQKLTDDVNELLILAKDYMLEAETVVKTLNRFSLNLRPNISRSHVKKYKKDPASVAINTNNEYFNQFSNIIDKLVSTGFYDIHAKTKEDITQLINENKQQVPDFNPPNVQTRSSFLLSNSVFFEYQWGGTEGDDKIYGPYDAKTMEFWKSRGMFSTNPVRIRKVNTGLPKIDQVTEPSAWQDIDRVEFDLYYDN